MFRQHAIAASMIENNIGTTMIILIPITGSGEKGVWCRV